MILLISQAVSYYPLNHRIAESQGLEGTSVDHLLQPPLPRQGHLKQVAQDHVQVGFEYLQRRRLHNLSGQPVPVLHHPQRDEVLLHVQMELPMFHFVSVVPCPVAGRH